MQIKTIKNITEKIKISQIKKLCILFGLAFLLVPISGQARMLFLPSEYISFSPTKGESEIFREKDLKITLENFDEADNNNECKFIFKEYGKPQTENNTKTYTVNYENGKCEYIFKAQEQIYQSWDIGIELKISDGTVFRNDTSYLFKAGAISVVNIAAN
jgi:hypothetical protein